MSGHWWSGVRKPMSEAEWLGDIPLGTGDACVSFSVRVFIVCTLYIWEVCGNTVFCK